MGSSYLVTAIAMAAAMIVEKCILSGCGLKVMLDWLVTASGLSLRWPRRMCEGRDATYMGRIFQNSGAKFVFLANVGFAQSS